MLALKHFVFCLSVSAAYAEVEFQSWERPPDNNPDLNRKGLGPMQDAWETIKGTANQTYYLIYSSGLGTEAYYRTFKCIQAQTRYLNQTLKSANYTSKWYHPRSKKIESNTQYVQAVKQKDYSIENAMHLDQPQRKATSRNGSCYNLDFDSTCEVNGCAVDHKECWRGPLSVHSEKYVLFDNSFCYILRSLLSQFGFESCEFWLREDWVKKHLSIPEVQIEESEKKEEESENKDRTTYPYDSLFKQLPSSCRYAFLLNCGYPEYRMYDKEICDKINEEKNAASGDTNGSN
ncbi:uncharacterized protein LOC121837923 [Ixodes scapularis]|uniref:uncharacterized protein LOC121837923 n=1 Tax=Ixodes scapularis TaxID=6945 RepID=UPI001C382D61|nr:uncharacterized protein LOC121837923 [Ixodes scapularis]